MSALFKKHLSRRTFIRGVGVTMSLPFLDAMVPARTLLAQTAARPQIKLGLCFIPHGAVMNQWTPTTTGALELSPILSPLAAHKDSVVVLSNLASFNPEAAANRVVELVLADKLEPESESKDSKPPAAGPAAVEVAPEVLDRYVGKFHLDVGALVTFSRQGSKLLGQLAGQQPFELVGPRIVPGDLAALQRMVSSPKGIDDDKCIHVPCVEEVAILARREIQNHEVSALDGSFIAAG